MILYPFIYLHLYLYRLCRCRCRCLRPLSLPLPHFSLRRQTANRQCNQQSMQCHNATASKRSRHCGERQITMKLSSYCDRLSRYCDHWKRQRQPGSIIVGHANIPWPTSRPRKQLHSEPRLRLMIRQRSHACFRIAASPAGREFCTCGRCHFRQTSLSRSEGSRQVPHAPPQRR